MLDNLMNYSQRFFVSMKTQQKKISNIMKIMSIQKKDYMRNLQHTKITLMS